MAALAVHCAGGQLFFVFRQRKVAKENEPESRGKGVAALLIFPCSLDSRPLLRKHQRTAEKRHRSLPPRREQSTGIKGAVRSPAHRLSACLTAQPRGRDAHRFPAASRCLRTVRPITRCVIRHDGSDTPPLTCNRTLVPIGGSRVQRAGGRRLCRLPSYFLVRFLLLICA